VGLELGPDDGPIDVSIVGSRVLGTEEGPEDGDALFDDKDGADVIDVGEEEADVGPDDGADDNEIELVVVGGEVAEVGDEESGEEEIVVGEEDTEKDDGPVVGSSVDT